MKAMSIYEALPEIIREVQPISKDRTNPQQGYKFRGIEDVYAALNLLLAKYGVTIIPHKVLESHHEAFQTAKGSQMFRHMIKVQYKLAAADGSFDFAEGEGEGMDSGDKATAKAQSTAYKAMAFQLFCIPTGEKNDTEEDSPEVLPQNGNGHAKQAPEKKAEKAAKLTAELRTALEATKGNEKEFESACAKIKEATDKEWITAKQRDELHAVAIEVFKTFPVAQPAQASK